MKTRHLLTLALITLLGSMTAYSQSASDLHGTWELNYTTTLASLTGTAQSKHAALSNEAQTYLQNGMDGLTIDFTSGGQYTLNSPEGDQVTGTWQWVTSAVDLAVTVNQVTKTYHIQGLSSTNLVIRVAETNDDKVIFHTWYLDKQ